MGESKDDIMARSNRKGALGYWATACAMVGMLFAASPVSAIDLNEECIASILNRSVQVNPDGTFALPNVPVPLGAFRVRVVCDRGDGTVEI